MAAGFHSRIRHFIVGHLHIGYECLKDSWPASPFLLHYCTDLKLESCTVSVLLLQKPFWVLIGYSAHNGTPADDHWAIAGFSTTFVAHLVRTSMYDDHANNRIQMIYEID